MAHDLTRSHCRADACVSCGRPCTQGAQCCRECADVLKTMPVAERFWSHVDRRGPDDCWLWTAGRFKCGYGEFNLDGEPRYSHRTTWELVHGPIPPGLCVCHSCDVRLCCNPRHLWLGTRADNNRDMTEKGRRHSPGAPGEKNGSAKLTADDVVAIRRLCDSGQTRTSVAAIFGISRVETGYIANRKVWRHIS